MNDQSLNITVLGAGLMGHGIAQDFACAGHAVVESGPEPAVIAQVHSRFTDNLAMAGIDVTAVVARIALDSDLASAVRGADMVIEAAPERLALKQSLFKDIVAAAPSDCILASDTSVISIAQIGEALEAAARARMVGTHWWNPPNMVPLYLQASDRPG